MRMLSPAPRYNRPWTWQENWTARSVLRFQLKRHFFKVAGAGVLAGVALAGGAYIMNHASGNTAPTTTASDHHIKHNNFALSRLQAVLHNAFHPKITLPHIARTPRSDVMPAPTPPPAIQTALLNASRGDQQIYEVATRIAFLESHFRAEVWNPGSHACGLMQIMTTNTLPGLLARHGKEHGYSIFSPVSRCTEAQFSANLGVDYMQDNRVYLETALNRQLTYADIYFAHVLGAGGAQRFLSAYDRGSENERVDTYLSDAEIQGNPGYFFQPGTSVKAIRAMDRDQLRTVGEAYDDIAYRMTETPLAPFTNRVLVAASPQAPGPA